MKKNLKNLRLNSETVRQLGTVELARIAGGQPKTEGGDVPSQCNWTVCLSCFASDCTGCL